MLGGLRSLLAVPAAAGVLVAALVVGARDRDNAPRCHMLLPAYVPPDAVPDLARHARPQLIVVNPDSGPGAARDDAYVAAVRGAQRAGAQVLGYVATGYGARPPADVEADVDRYAEWYGTDGIFLDEAAAAPSQLARYRALARHIRTASGAMVVLNPGTVPDRGYFDVADVIVTFEGPYTNYSAAMDRAPGWVRDLPRGRSAVLVYGATRQQASTVVSDTRHDGYVYVTSGTLPHPWGTVPEYVREHNGPLGGCGSPVQQGNAEVAQ
jgi:spherulation-specific family 4 protein